MPFDIKMNLPEVALIISAFVNIVLMFGLVIIPETLVSLVYGIGPLDHDTPSGEVALFLGAGASAYAAGVAILMILAYMDKNPIGVKLALQCYGYTCLFSALYTLFPFPIAFPGPLSRRILFLVQSSLMAILNLVAAAKVRIDGYSTIIGANSSL
mmetsp:Transcript_13374/g.17451  ORF Transcript_13374/g.17451 Transcript_13374/m.17451 type:complete len:155 (+) Transcript_13374:62-526(+)